MNSQDSKYQVNITPNAVANIKEIVDFYVDAMNYPPAANEFRYVKSSTVNKITIRKISGL